MSTKLCKSCNECLPITRFTTSKRTRDGYEGKCKDCRQKNRPDYKHTCVVCEAVFTSKKKEAKCCGRSCVGKLRSKLNSVIKNCTVCQKEIKVAKSSLRERNYCGFSCYGVDVSKRMTGENNKNYVKRIKLECFSCGKSVYKKPKDAERVKYHFCNMKCFSDGIGVTRSGELAHNYNPELTDEERRIRRSYTGYRKWRDAVLERDANTCVKCFVKKDSWLVAHHLYSYSTHVHLREEVDNGVTLCEDCHRAFHGLFGYFENTKEEFLEFIQDTSFSVGERNGL